MIDTIAFKFRTGMQWVHLPERCGRWRAVDNRLRLCASTAPGSGFTALTAQADKDQDLNWAVSVGSMVVRTHQHPSGPERGSRPDVVLADQAYSSRAIRDHLCERGIRMVIPIPADQSGHGVRRGSRNREPPAFDREACKQWITVERRVNRLDQWRGIAARCEQPAPLHLAGLHVADVFL